LARNVPTWCEDRDVQRVSVVGNSGSGKSRLARRIAAAIDAPYVELDAINHQPGWTPRDPEELLVEVERITRGDRWVIDGNYRAAVVDGPVWERADTVVWLRLPRRIVMHQIVGRTLRRVLTRERLWNGNREPFANLYRWNPEKNVIRWAWTQHAKYEQRYTATQHDPRFAHIHFVELRAHAEATAWLAALTG
jgi:adenylate kinase family enzyme